MSFRLKTILGIALIELLLLTTLILSGLNWLRDSNEQQLIASSERLAGLFVSATRDAVLTTDLATLQAFVDGVIRHRQVVYIYILDDRQQLLAEALSGEPGTIQLGVRPTDTVDGVYDISVPILVDGSIDIGRIELGFDVSDLQQLISSAGLFGTTLGVVEMVLVALFSLLLGTWLTRQLHQLRDAANLVRQQGPGTTIVVRGRDEIAEVATAFNEMSRSLQDSYQALQREKGRYATLAEQHAILAEIVEQAGDAFIITDTDGGIGWSNPAFSQLTGFRRSDIAGRTLQQLLVGQESSPQTLTELQRAISSKQPHHVELLCYRQSGSPFWADIVLIPISDHEDQVIRFAYTLRDISERRRVNSYLQRMAHTDMLTGLANRNRTFDVLQALIEAESATPFTLIYLDLDRFKLLNDVYGHDLGDRVLRTVGERLLQLRSQLREIGRIGGDEFAIVVEMPVTSPQISEICSDIATRIAATITLQDREYALGCAMGVCGFPEDASSARQMLQYADTAMYHVKRQHNHNGERWKRFTPQMQQQAEREVALHQGLQQALQSEHELFVHYQPQYRANDGALVGVEALLRWRSPILGVVSPAEFIPVAELSGIMSQLSNWVFERVGLEMSQLQLQGVAVPRVSINLSAHDFDLATGRRIDQLLRRYRLQPSQLTIEITESQKLDLSDQVLQGLVVLREQGLHLSIDDFGTGYSSLAHIAQLQPDEVKIDQHFIQAAVTDPKRRAVVEAIVAMSHALGYQVVAEGVEDVAQVALLQQIDMSILLQGFLLGRPAALADVIAAGDASLP